MPSRRGTLLSNLLLAAGSVAGLVLLVELGAKVVGLPVGEPLLPNRYNCLRRSALLGMELRPHCHGDFSYTAFDTNDLGLRSPEVRDDGTRRILAIGDSCTWGWAVPQDASYPDVLQQLLDERSGTARYQVINAGTPGYTSYQGLLYLRERGLALRPVIVILGYGFNDASMDGDVEEHVAAARRILPLLVASDILSQHSRIYGFFGRMMHHPDRRPRVDATRFAHNLTDMVELARDHGAHALALSFSTTQTGPYAEALASVTTRLAVPVIAYDGPLLDVVHPTAAGYRALAARILERLEQEGWVE